MKFFVSKFLAVLLVLGVMLALPKAAEAHNVSGAKYQASYHGNDAPPPANVSGGSSFVVAFTNSNQDDKCETGCCSMTAACCSQASLAQAEFSFQQFPAVFDFMIGSQVLPQGPPYELLRPPKSTT